VEDLYAALGVSKTASADDIKKAYREAAFKYHPDRNPGDKAAEEKFKTISAAYAILGDDAKRRDYDRYGSADAYARASSYTTPRQEGYEQTGDPFWDWFNNSAEGRGKTYTWYGQTSNRSRREEKDSYEPSKGEAFAMLVRSALILCAGLFFFRYSWFILPIGPILSIGAIINGASGILKSLKRIFSSPKT
jgi:molecular chaperone DnaJ